MPPSVAADLPQYKFDLTAASAIVKEYSLGSETHRLLLMPDQESRRIAESLREQWQAAGISVTLDQGAANFFDLLIKGDYDLALAYYGPFLQTSEQYLWPYREGAIPAPNVMGYRSAALEKLYQQFTATNDPAQAKPALSQCVQTVMEDSPAVWIVKLPRVEAVRGTIDAPRESSIPVFVNLTGQPR